MGNGTAGDGFALGAWASSIERRLERWQQDGFGERLWAKDPSLWADPPFPGELADRLGWLDLPRTGAEELPRLAALAAEAAAQGAAHAVVLGMGGSSLAPEVFAATFGHAPGHPEVLVLDSTHPDAVRAMAGRLDPARSLFLVSSKSGGTTETMSFFRFFWERAARAGGADPGRRFLAITDPGTPLAALGRERGFRAVVLAPPDVGGRYSAFTDFGLVPAALQGMDAAALLARGREMAELCGPGVAAAANPGLVLGAVLGELALAGRDKLTLLTSPSIAAFPAWLEQLVAESTGKDGKGIVPVAGEPPGEPGAYGDDRVFAALLVAGDADDALGRTLAELEALGHPVIRLALRDALDLGREIFRWEVAVATAGAVLRIHPFNQPDVQLAKELAKAAMAQRPEGGAGRGPEAVPAADAGALARAAQDWLAGLTPGEYLGLQAYLAPGPAAGESLRRLQGALRDRTRRAVTAGWGPRFLHSTGQLHKGGPAGGRFLQLVDRPREDLAVPETGYSFGTLIRAQAAGDRKALERKGRTVLTVDLGEDREGGLARLAEVLPEAVPAVQPEALRR